MYLEELRHARQWRSVKPSVEAGDLVLLVEIEVAQGHWQLTVVKEVPSSVDELVYIIIVKIKAGKYKNPPHNLTPLNLIILKINLQVQFCKL
jgi:hypothetical protein